MSLKLAERPVWSRSQVTALGECRRKFSLLTKAGRNGAIDPVLARAAALKKLKNRHLWTGSFIHKEMGNVLKTLRQGNSPPPIDMFVETAKTALRERFKASRDGLTEPGADRLFEHEYRQTLSPEIWRGHWNTIETALRWFMQSKWLERLAALGPECWKAVDDLLEFDVNGIKAYVKIDCAIETEGRFVLIDWTTSSSLSKVEPGLLVAALYAHEVWGAAPEQTEALAVSLLDGKTFHAEVNEESLMNAHLRIEEESAVLEEARVQLPSDPFSVELAENIETCRRCNFQKLCHPKGVL